MSSFRTSDQIRFGTFEKSSNTPDCLMKLCTFLFLLIINTHCLLPHIIIIAVLQINIYTIQH